MAIRKDNSIEIILDVDKINDKILLRNYILKTLRWLFIEQDVTYWSGSGRQMLFNGILGIS